MNDIVIPVGVDDGYAMTKVYTWLPNDSFPTAIKIRSSVRTGVHGVIGINGEFSTNNVGAYETEGIRYTVGDQIDGENTRYESYAGSPLNRIVIHHALRQAGLATKTIKIATGLPFDHYYTPDGINKRLIEAKIRSFSVPVSAVDGGDVAKIEENIVCAEAVSAWLDHVLDDFGNFKPDANVAHPLGVVDIGGKTTDTVWIYPPENIDRLHSGTENIGVLDLLDTIGVAIQKKYDLTSISRGMLEMAAATKKIRLFGKDADVSDIVDAAIEEISDRVYREIQRRFGNGAELDMILFVGGGAKLMPSLAGKFRNGVLVDDPEFANARGMYKYLRYKMNNV